MKKNGKHRNSTYIDRAGIRYGLLVVLHEVESEAEMVIWRCECDCGRQVNVTSSNLKTKRHCGCQKRTRVGNNLNRRPPTEVNPVLNAWLSGRG